MTFLAGEFNDSFEPIMDGVANVTKNYAYWLNKKNVQSCVITPIFPQYIDSQNYNVYRYLSINLPKRAPYRLGIPYLDYIFLKKVNNIPFDIVHAHCPFSSGQVALNIAKKKDIPIVATFHSKYYDDFLEVLKSEHASQLLVKRVINFFNKVDIVWTVNKSTIKTLRSYGYNGNVDVVNNGTDFKPPEDFEKTINEANKRLNLYNKKIVFLFVGQLIWQKNLKMLVDSLNILKKMNIDFTMLFVGEGYAGEELKNLVNDYELNENIKFLGAIRDREFLKSLFARADLFLFPSLYDTAGIVIQEAAAVKCPSLVIEDSCASEGIIDGYNGFLSKDDSIEYAKKIFDIVKNAERLPEIGDRASKTLYRTWENVVEEVKQKYIYIIKEHKKQNVI